MAGSRDRRFIEFVDHLHEHFVTPVVVRDGHYLAPSAPGSGAEMLGASIESYRQRPPDPGRPPQVTTR